MPRNIPQTEPKTLPLGIRLDPADHAALVQLAAADDRPVSAMVRRILQDWVRKQAEKQAKSAAWRERRA